MSYINPVPQTWEPGQVTRSGGYTAVPAVLSKGGSTRGSSTVTLAGTPTYGLLLQYTLDLTNAINGQVSSQTGLFAYNRSSAAASLADLITKFSAHLARYHDVEITGTSATTITMRSLYWGFTPNLTIQTASITATNALTTATAPAGLVPGDLVVLNQTMMGYTVQRFQTANITATSLFGITLLQPRPMVNDGRDQVLNVLVDGYVGCQLGGTGAKVASTASLVAFLDGTRPGQLSVSGFTSGATVGATFPYSSGTIGPVTPNNLSRTITAISTDCLPGQVMEVRIQR